MKLTTTFTAVAIALLFLAVAVGNLQAEVTNTITIAITGLAQNAPTTNNGIITAAAPSKHAIGIKEILNLLAIAKHAANNAYPTTNFPVGAKLVVITGDNNAFQVLSATNSLLVDVSDIMSSSDGKFENDIFSGSQNATNGLASPKTTDVHVLKVNYDDTWINGSVGVKFYMIGMMTSTVAETAPVAGVYTRTESNKLVGGLGEGFFQEQPFVLTGTLTASGKGTLTLAP